MQFLSDQGLTFGSPNLMAASAQHLDISASIASNAITVTLNPCTLSFRNATLTTGTPAVVAVTAPLTLTIAATDSFGLTTVFGSQRLVILCFNDAGTPRLAASALYGGVNLDETNLLSASTASTTAAAIDAGVVITSKAYKVVGFVDATFTTAVGWGSLALVQPAGGNALTAMSSLGYGQTWQNVLGSRASGTTYYNTTGKPIQVYAISSGSNTIAMTVNGLQISPATTALVVTASAIVPSGASYSISSAGIGVWSELR